jgi:hypothetical protein
MKIRNNIFLQTIDIIENIYTLKYKFYIPVNAEVNPESIV